MPFDRLKKAALLSVFTLDERPCFHALFASHARHAFGSAPSNRRRLRASEARSVHNSEHMNADDAHT